MDKKLSLSFKIHSLTFGIVFKACKNKALANFHASRLQHCSLFVVFVVFFFFRQKQRGSSYFDYFHLAKEPFQQAIFESHILLKQRIVQQRNDSDYWEGVKKEKQKHGRGLQIIVTSHGTARVRQPIRNDPTCFQTETAVSQPQSRSEPRGGRLCRSSLQLGSASSVISCDFPINSPSFLYHLCEIVFSKCLLVPFRR